MGIGKRERERRKGGNDIETFKGQVLFVREDKVFIF